ncbi:MAG: GNAT family N-acetyltransferase [Pseudomonadota bacterium]
MTKALKAPSLVTPADPVHRHRMLETNRLVLRKWKRSDEMHVATILGDPDVMAFSDHGVLTSKQLLAWFEKACAVCPDDLLSGPLAIAQKATDDLIGYIGLSHDPDRIAEGDAEIGFRLSKSVWGQGYASEAAAELVRRTNEVSSISRIVAIVDPGNTRSIRVLDKLGMSLVGEIMFDGYDYPDMFYALKLRDT